MGKTATIRTGLVGIALFLGTAAALVGCGGNPELNTGGTTEDGGPPPSPDADASNPIITQDSSKPPPPRDVTPGDCTPISCSADAATYCGKIGNGCGGTLDCGDCTGGRECVQNVCSMPVDGCAPLTCMQVGGTYCGRIGDGCGRLLDCGTCGSPLTCAGGGTPNVCGAAPDSGACMLTNCSPMNGKYCGVVGNGCGGQMDCGGCPAGEGCGADNIPHLCGVIGCMPASCVQASGRYCGIVGDGCGGQMDCGACTNGQTCGGAGLDGVCGFPPDSGACTPPSCVQANGKYCGIVGNGCGGQMDCGGCPANQTCGGAGVGNVCAYPPDSGACTPLTCNQANGQYCGIVGNGCGGQMDCGGCPANQACGGMGLPNICGFLPDSGA